MLNKPMYIKWMRNLFLMALCLGILAIPVFSKEIVVAPNIYQNADPLREALASPNLQPGDVIVLKPGLYRVSGNATGQNGPLIWPNKDNITLKGFAISGAGSAGPLSVLDGASSSRLLIVPATHNVDLVIRDVFFQNGKAPDGMLVFNTGIPDGANGVNGNTGQDGGAIYKLGSGTLSIYGCFFKDNRAGDGSAGADGNPGTDRAEPAKAPNGLTGSQGQPNYEFGNVDVGDCALTWTQFTICLNGPQRKYDGAIGAPTGGNGGPGGTASDGIKPIKAMNGGNGGHGGEGGRGAAIYNAKGIILIHVAVFDTNISGKGGKGGQGGQGGKGGKGGDGGDGGAGGRAGMRGNGVCHAYQFVDAGLPCCGIWTCYGDLGTRNGGGSSGSPGNASQGGRGGDGGESGDGGISGRGAMSGFGTAIFNDSTDSGSLIVGTSFSRNDLGNPGLVGIAGIPGLSGLKGLGGSGAPGGVGDGSTGAASGPGADGSWGTTGNVGYQFQTYSGISPVAEGVETLGQNYNNAIRQEYVVRNDTFQVFIPAWRDPSGWYPTYEETNTELYMTVFNPNGSVAIPRRKVIDVHGTNVATDLVNYAFSVSPWIDGYGYLISAVKTDSPFAPGQKAVFEVFNAGWTDHLGKVFQFGNGLQQLPGSLVGSGTIRSYSISENAYEIVVPYPPRTQANGQFSGIGQIKTYSTTENAYEIIWPNRVSQNAGTLAGATQNVQVKSYTYFENAIELSAAVVSANGYTTTVSIQVLNASNQVLVPTTVIIDNSLMMASRDTNFFYTPAINPGLNGGQLVNVPNLGQLYVFASDFKIPSDNVHPTLNAVLLDIVKTQGSFPAGSKAVLRFTGPNALGQMIAQTVTYNVGTTYRQSLPLTMKITSVTTNAVLQPTKLMIDPINVTAAAFVTVNFYEANINISHGGKMVTSNFGNFYVFNSDVTVNGVLSSKLQIIKRGTRLPENLRLTFELFDINNTQLASANYLTGVQAQNALPFYITVYDKNNNLILPQTLLINAATVATHNAVTTNFFPANISVANGGALTALYPSIGTQFYVFTSPASNGNIKVHLIRTAGRFSDGQKAVYQYSNNASGIANATSNFTAGLNVPSSVLTTVLISVDDPYLTQWFKINKTPGFGGKILKMGDNNGDGFDDMAVTDTTANVVYIYYGGPNMDGQEDIVIPLGPTHNVGDIAALDINHDGLADLLIGDPLWSDSPAPGQEGKGRIAVFYGRRTAFATNTNQALLNVNLQQLPTVLSMNDAQKQFGKKFSAGKLGSGGNQVNAIVAMQSDKTYVYKENSGTFTATLLSASKGWANDLAVEIINALNNNSGRRDIALGDPHSGGNFSVADNGLVEIYNGDSLILELTLSPDNPFQPQLHFGGSLSGAGNINGDAFDDLLVGQGNFSDTSSFRSWAILGGSGKSPEVDGSRILLLQPFFGGADGFGANVAGNGDIDGPDQSHALFSDFIVSAPNDHDGTGAIYSFLGGPVIDLQFTLDDLITSNYLHLIRGQRPTASAFLNPLFGKSVAMLGNMNGGGYSMVGVGAPGIGQVYVYRNTYSNDITAPTVLDGVYLHNQTGVAGTPSENFKFRIYDQGNTGLNVSELKLFVYEKGQLGDAELLTAYDVVNHTARYTAFQANTLKQQWLSGTVQTPYLRAPPQITYANNNQVNPEWIEVSFSPNFSLKEAARYVFNFQIIDKQGFQSGSLINGNQMVNTFNFITNQKILQSWKKVLEPSAPGPVTSIIYNNMIDGLRTIGDFNGDGIDDFVLANGDMTVGVDLPSGWVDPAYSNNHFALMYFGGNNFDLAVPDLILIGPVKSGSSHFGTAVAGGKFFNTVGINGVKSDVAISFYDGSDSRLSFYADSFSRISAGTRPAIINTGKSFTGVMVNPQFMTSGFSADNDNLDDLAVLNSNGTVTLFRSSSSQATFGNFFSRYSGLTPGSHRGLALSASALYIGDPFGNANAGQVVKIDTGVAYSYNNNPVGELLVFAQAIKPQDLVVGDNFGFSLAVNAQIENSTAGTLVVGAPGSDFNGQDAGRVYIFDANLNTPKYELTGESVGEQFGYSLTIARHSADPGDALTGTQYRDLYDEVVVGAPFYKDRGRNLNGVGKVYIFNGKATFDTKADFGFSGSFANSQLGRWVDRANIQDNKDDNGNKLHQILVSGLAKTSCPASVINPDCEGQLYILDNSELPDTSPPSLTSAVPESFVYDVGVTQTVVLKFKDVSGIKPQSFSIFRIIDGQPYRYYEGAPIAPYALGGTRIVSINFQREIPGDNTRWLATIQKVVPNRKLIPNAWDEGESLKLRIYIEDTAKTFDSLTGGFKERNNGVFLDYGFVVDFPEISAFNENKIFGGNGQGQNFIPSFYPNSKFALSTQGVGDINGDYLPDFIVGEPSNPGNGPDSGKVYIYYGNDQGSYGISINANGTIAPNLTINLGAGSSTAMFGYQVAKAGNFNGDNYLGTPLGDIAVAALNSSGTAGEVFLFLGYKPEITAANQRWDASNFVYTNAISIQATDPSEGFGRAIAGGGDINGDGYDDLIIGAPNANGGKGRVYVILGRKGLSGLQSAFNRNGQHGSIRVGNGIVALADFDWANFNPEALPGDLGSSAQLGFYIDNPDNGFNSQFGFALAIDGNLNGDKVAINQNNITRYVPLADLLIGAPGDSNGNGKVYIYSFDTTAGPNKFSLRQAIAGSNGEAFGFSVAHLSDISNDNPVIIGEAWSANNAYSYGDFVVGAPKHVGPGNKVNAGATYLFVTNYQAVTNNVGSIFITHAPSPANFNYSISNAMRMDGMRAGDQFGFSVARASNLDNDIYANPDIMVGAPFYDLKKTEKENKFGVDLIDSGRIFVFGTPLVRFNPADVNSPLVLKADNMADLSIKGFFSGHFYGYSISDAGDIDAGGGDGVSEFLVGAPAFGGNTFGSENFGRVYLYTFPDKVNPWVDMNFISPQENQINVSKNITDINYTGPLRIRFVVQDDRAVKYGAVRGTVQGVLYPPFDIYPDRGPTINFRFDDLTSTTNYIFVENRRKVNFYVIPDPKKIRYRDVVTVKIYAEDLAGNQALKTNAPNELQAGKLQAPVVYSFTIQPNPKGAPEYITFVNSPNIQYVITRNIELNFRAWDASGGIVSYNIGVFGAIFQTDLGSSTALINFAAANAIKYTYDNILNKLYLRGKMSASELSQLLAIYPVDPERARLQTLYQQSQNNPDILTLDTTAQISWSTTPNYFTKTAVVPNPAFQAAAWNLTQIPGNVDPIAVFGKVKVLLEEGEGTKTIPIVLRDKFVNESDPYVLTLIYDINPPHLDFIKPAQASTHNIREQQVHFGISDYGSGLDLSTFVLTVTSSSGNWNRVYHINDLAPADRVGTPTNNADTAVVNSANFKIRPKLDTPLAYQEWVTVNIYVKDRSAVQYPTHLLNYNLVFRVSPDYTAPQDGVILLNNGEQFATANVAVTMIAADDVGVTGYYLFGDIIPGVGVINPNQWYSVAPSKQITLRVQAALSSPNMVGTTRNVYVKFRDAQGNESAVFGSTIILDGNANGGPYLTKVIIYTNNSDLPQVISPATAYVNSPFIKVQVRAFDEDSTNGEPESFKIWGTGLDPTANNAAVYIGSAVEPANYVDFDSAPTFNYLLNKNYFNLLLTQGEGTKVFSVVFYDVTGNASRTQNMTLILDQTPPLMVSANNISGLGVPGYTAQTEKLNATFVASDALSGVYRYNYRVYEKPSNAPVSPDILLGNTNGVNVVRGSSGFPNANNLNNQATVQVLQTLKTNGEKYYFVVKALDRAGNISTDLNSNTMLVDGPNNIPETPVINFYSGIVLNRPIMDVDFYDGQSGIGRVIVFRRNNLADSDATDIPISSFGEALKPLTDSTTFVTTFYRGVSANWTIPSTIWNNAVEGSNTSLVFNVFDKVSNQRTRPGQSQTDQVITFRKDTTPPTGVALNYVNNQFAFNTSSVSLNFSAGAETDFYAIGEKSIANTLQQIVDYSFEDSGYAGLKNSPYWKSTTFKRTNGQDYPNSFENYITLTGSDGTGIGGLLSDVKFDRKASFQGNFAYKLAFHFTNRVENGELLQNWPGVSRVVTLSATNSANAQVYTVIQAVNASDFDVNNHVPLVVSFSDGKLPEQTVGGLGGTFQTSFYYSSAPVGDAWNIISGRVTVSAGVATATIRISFGPTNNPLNRAVTSIVTGSVLIDDTLVLPGYALYSSKAIGNQNNIGKKILLAGNGQGIRNISAGVRDSIGNWVFVSRNVIFDQTSPNAVGVTNDAFIKGVNGQFNALSAYSADGSNLRVIALGRDNESGIKYYYFKIYDQGGSFFPVLPGEFYRVPDDGSVINVSSPQYTWNYSQAVNGYRALRKGGIYRVVMQTEDYVGRRSGFITSNTISIDLRSPASTINYPASYLRSIGAGQFVPSGWYSKPVVITFNATDNWLNLNAADGPLNQIVTGSGVTTLNYIANGGPTTSVRLREGEKFALTLNQEGANTLTYWTQDQLGWNETTRVIKPLTFDNRGRKVIYRPYATSVDAYPIYGFIVDTRAPIVTTNLTGFQNKWVSGGVLPKFTVSDGVGDGVANFYYKLDTAATVSAIVDTGPIGHPDPATFNTLAKYLPPYNQADSTPRSVPVIYPFTRAVDAIEQEGVHSATFWATDKFGNESTHNVLDHIQIDRGNGEIFVDLGGNLQGIWVTSPSGLTVNYEVQDFFQTVVTFNIADYPDGATLGALVDPPVQGSALRKPGSGVVSTMFWINILGINPIVQPNPGLLDGTGRWGYKNRFIVTANGQNFVGYRITDRAGNATNLPFPGSWNGINYDPLLIVPIYNGDNQILRHLWFDNKPPQTASVSMGPNPTAAYNPYAYTAQYVATRTVEINLQGHDQGIGMRFAYIAGDVVYDQPVLPALQNPDFRYNNIIPPIGVPVPTVKSLDVVDDVVPFLNPTGEFIYRTPRAFVPVNRWFQISDYIDTLADRLHWPLRATANRNVYVRTTAGDGVKKIKVWLADDFVISSPTRSDHNLKGSDADVTTVNQVTYWRNDHWKYAGELAVTLDTVVNVGATAIPQKNIYGIVNTDSVTVVVKFTDKPNEKSGIYSVRLTGDLKFGPNVNNWLLWNPTSASVPTPQMSIPVRITDIDGNKRINVEFRDRAGDMWEYMYYLAPNTNDGRNQSAVFSDTLYYDTPMQDGEAHLRISVQESSFYVHDAYVHLNLNFPGANYLYVSGNLMNSSSTVTVNTPVGVPYASVVPIKLNDTVDGIKYFSVQVGELPSANRRSIVIDRALFLDRVYPTVTSDVQTSSFYVGSSGAVIHFTANDPVPSGGQASGIKGVYFRINNGVTQNGMQATITTRGTSNKLEYWTEDFSGNASSHNVVTGIKVETNPPQPLVVAPQIGRYYVNFRNVTMNMSGVNLTGFGVQLQYSGNIVNPQGGAVPYLRAFFANEVIRLTSGDGTKNVSILFQGQYVNAGPVTFNMILDTVPPVVPVVAGYNQGSNPISNLAVIDLSGTKEAGSTVLVDGVPAQSLSPTQWVMKSKRVPASGVPISVVARDLAFNYSQPVTFAVQLNNLGYVDPGDSGLPNGVLSVSVNAVAPTLNVFKYANDRIGGIRGNNNLDNTIRDFTAFGTMGQLLNNTAQLFANTNMQIVIPFYNSALNGGAKATNFRIFYFNPSTGLWEMVPGAQVVTVQNQPGGIAGNVKATVAHFSTYRIFESTGTMANFSNLMVYPNPFRPNSNGNSGSYGQGVKFENIVAGSELKIYTLSGALVRTLDDLGSDGVSDGIITWYGTNTAGEKVASGIYLYVIKAGSEKKVGRITVINN